MMRTKNKKLTPLSRALRKNMTKEEKKLWYDFFKLLPITVHRQKVIGRYIVDFYCAEAALVIELDGSQHSRKNAIINDFQRDSYLQELGLTVLRYSNEELHQNFEGVCADIVRYIPQLQDN